MEQQPKRIKYDDARSLLRRCFRNPLFSLVPFDIWKDILEKTTVQTTTTLVRITQTCKGFKDLVEYLQTNNLPLAKRYRRDGWITHAKKCLESCIENGNLDAKYCLLSAYMLGGWGYESNVGVANKMLREYTDALYIFTPLCLSTTERPISEWIQEAVKGNEFVQFQLGLYYNNQGKRSLAIHWLFKSAVQGYAHAQYHYDSILYGGGTLYGGGISKNRFWLYAAAKQGHSDATTILRDYKYYGCRCERHGTYDFVY